MLPTKPSRSEILFFTSAESWSFPIEPLITLAVTLWSALTSTWIVEVSSPAVTYSISVLTSIQRISVVFWSSIFIQEPGWDSSAFSITWPLLITKSLGISIVGATATPPCLIVYLAAIPSTDSSFSTVTTEPVPPTFIAWKISSSTPSRSVAVNLFCASSTVISAAFPLKATSFKPLIATSVNYESLFDLNLNVPLVSPDANSYFVSGFICTQVVPLNLASTFSASA